MNVIYDELTEEVAQLIVDTAGDFASTEFGIRDSYVGRGMYNRPGVVAITGYGQDERFIYMAIGMLIERGELAPNAGEWFARSEGLGHGWVIY